MFIFLPPFTKRQVKITSYKGKICLSAWCCPLATASLQSKCDFFVFRDSRLGGLSIDMGGKYAYFVEFDKQTLLLYICPFNIRFYFAIFFLKHLNFIQKLKHIYSKTDPYYWINLWVINRVSYSANEFGFFLF